MFSEFAVENHIWSAQSTDLSSITKTFRMSWNSAGVPGLTTQSWVTDLTGANACIQPKTNKQTGGEYLGKCGVCSTKMWHTPGFKMRCLEVINRYI